MSWKLVNALCYQMVWIACVAGAARHWQSVGVIATAAFVALVLGCGGHRKADLRLLPAVLLCGLLFDTTWIALGWIDYSAPWPSQPLSPPWILCIWIAFAMTLNHSLAFLKHRYGLAALFGAVVGPLAYWSASRGLGAVRFQAPAVVVLAGLGMAWTLVLPLLVWVADRNASPVIAEVAS